MVLRRALSEVISQATEATSRRTPVELFDLAGMQREPLRDDISMRSRDVEDVTPDEARPRRRPVAAAAPQPPQPGTVRHRDISAALSTTDGLRRALILREILGPPRSMSGWDDLP